MNKINNWQKVCISILGALGVSMIFGLLVMALFGQPVADQYYYMSQVRDNGVIGDAVFAYNDHSGRLIQSLGVGLSYQLFGDFGAQVIAPMILLGLFIAAFSWLAYLIFKFKNHRLILSIIIGLCFAGGTLYTTACLFDIYLWLDADFVYLLGMIAIVYDVALFVWLSRERANIKSKKILTAILLFFTLILQTAGESSMMLTLGWSIVALLACCIFKKFSKYRKAAIIMSVVLMAGGLIMILSPGLWNRAGANADGVTLSIFEVFIHSPLVAYRDMFSNISWWQIALIITIAVALGSLIARKVTSRHTWPTILGSVLIFISFTYLPMVLYFYGTRSTSIEARALAVPQMGLFISAVILIMMLYILVSNYIHKLHDPQKAKIFTIASIFILMPSIFFCGRGILVFDKEYFSVLATRSNAMEARAAQVQAYKDGLIDQITITDIPVMIKNSTAADFTVNNWATIDWFYDSFLRYYQLPASAVKVVGAPLRTEDAALDWYTGVSDDNICTSQSSIVDQLYICYNIKQ